MPPRPLRPKDEGGMIDGLDTPAETKSSKRRAVSSACIPCRKRKSKVSSGPQILILKGLVLNHMCSAMAVDHRVLRALLCTERSVFTTKIATIAGKVH